MKGLLREAAMLVALAFLPAVAAGYYQRNALSWTSPVAASDTISLDKALALGDKVLWIDARPSDEYAKDHIPSAVELNEDRWNEHLPTVLQRWSPNIPTIVYCSSVECGASREVARRLRSSAGLTNVFVLDGGWEAWQARRK